MGVERIHFARCLVDVSAETLPTSVIPILLGRTNISIEVSYEADTPHCSRCRSFGHLLGQCPLSSSPIPSRARPCVSGATIDVDMILRGQPPCASPLVPGYDLFNLSCASDTLPTFLPEQPNASLMNVNIQVPLSGGVAPSPTIVGRPAAAPHFSMPATPLGSPSVMPPAGSLPPSVGLWFRLLIGPLFHWVLGRLLPLLVRLLVRPLFLCVPPLILMCHALCTPLLTRELLLSHVLPLQV